MKNYLVKLEPLEPYFFGNEKSLWFGDVKSRKTNSYFIKSNDTPSATTILGALRFSLINEHYNVFSKEESVKKSIFNKIGEESFDIKKDDQKFGNIKRISPLLLTCKNERGENIYFIKTPFDHKINDKNKVKNLYYKPFSRYEKCVTSEGEKYLPLDYNPKDGICDCFLNLTTMEICDDFFTPSVKVGIKTNSHDEGFFKKEYKKLKKGLSFAVFAEIDGEVKDKIVFLGQDKSAFSLSFNEIKDDFNYWINLNENLFIEKKRTFLENSSIAIALSDIYVDKKIYDFCYFVNSATREHRTFKTNYGEAANFRGRYEKNNEVIYLLKAGSMFLVKNEKLEDFKKEINKENCQNIGLNICIYGGF